MITERPAQAYLWRDDDGPLVDPAHALSHLATADPILGALMDRTGALGLAPPPRRTPFQSLLRAIVHQQLSGKAAQTIFGRVCALYSPRPWPSPKALLATHPLKLRKAGLSRAKALAVKDLARHASEGRVPGAARLRRLEADEIVARLTQVRGIGRWTVEMLLIFHLGHPDILPADDLGIRKGFALTYRTRGLPAADRVERHAQRWRPYRSIASWYLWRALDAS
ncbi:MAG: DNA-3-methyladenine glycosylase 2 family protein [Gemmatimonadota bacterium]